VPICADRTPSVPEQFVIIPGYSASRPRSETIRIANIIIFCKNSYKLNSVFIKVIEKSEILFCGQIDLPYICTTKLSVMVFLRILLLYVIIFGILTLCIQYLKWIGRKGKSTTAKTIVSHNAGQERQEEAIRQVPPEIPVNIPDPRIQNQQRMEEDRNRQFQDTPHRNGSAGPAAENQKPEGKGSEEEEEQKAKEVRKRKNLIITGIVICVIILAFVLGRHSGKSNQPGSPSDSSLTEAPAMEDSAAQDTTSDDVDEDDNNYDWLQGTWVGQTPYGTVQLIISGTHIKSQDNSGISTGTFNIQNGQIIATYKGGQTFAYTIDTNKYRIGYGKGIYLYKGSSDTQMDESTDENNGDDQDQGTDQETDDNSKNDQEQEKIDSTKHPKGTSRLQNKTSRSDKVLAKNQDKKHESKTTSHSNKIQ
jgi:flagellar basal body-associated protein FliL